METKKKTYIDKYLSETNNAKELIQNKYSVVKSTKKQRINTSVKVIDDDNEFLIKSKSKVRFKLFNYRRR